MQYVQNFCSELQKISLPHEEKLSPILNTLDHEISRKFKHLSRQKTEIDGESQNKDFSSLMEMVSISKNQWLIFIHTLDV